MPLLLTNIETCNDDLSRMCTCWHVKRICGWTGALIVTACTAHALKLPKFPYNEEEQEPVKKKQKKKKTKKSKDD